MTLSPYFFPLLILPPDWCKVRGPVEATDPQCIMEKQARRKKRNTCWAAWPQLHTKSEESFFVFTIFHKTIYASSRPTYASALVLYLWRRDVEHFCDLGVQLLYVSESVDSPRRTPVSQLGVEDEFRSWVVWRPGRWRWRRRQRRCCGLHISLIRSLLSSFLFLHDLGPCCLLWAHCIPVLHQAPELRSRYPQGTSMVHCSGSGRNSVLPPTPRLTNRQATRSFRVDSMNELVMRVTW